MSIQVVDVVEPVACPCGGVRWEMGVIGIKDAPPRYHVYCEVCENSGPASSSQREAVLAWNAENGPEPAAVVKPFAEPAPASQAALAVVAAAVRVKLARGGWGRGVDGMVIRLSKELGEALLVELGMTQGEAK